jgi:hypothetical protein
MRWQLEMSLLLEEENKWGLSHRASLIIPGAIS